VNDLFLNYAGRASSVRRPLFTVLLLPILSLTVNAPVSAQDAPAPLPEGCVEPCQPPPSLESLVDEGVRFAVGKDVEKDEQRAAGLFRRACDGGNARGCSNLGVLYHRGQGGIVRDDAHAARLFEQSCNAGHAPACHHLGLLYEPTDNGVVRAVDLFRRSCEGGFREACKKLPEAQGASSTPGLRPAPTEQESPERCDSTSAQRHDKLCWTPRNGVVSGFVVALDLGILSPSPALKTRLSLGTGVTIAARVGLTFLDQLTLDASYGGILILSSASEDPERGSVVSGDFLNFEGGYQKRFRISRSQSIVPGAMVGYTHGLGDLTRTLSCENCEDAAPTRMNPSGANLSAFVRTTFGRMGRFAIFVRTRWFLTGDLLHDFGAGFEGGLP
jgi:hypothetical protein